MDRDTQEMQSWWDGLGAEDREKWVATDGGVVADAGLVVRTIPRHLRLTHGTPWVNQLMSISGDVSYRPTNEFRAFLEGAIVQYHGLGGDQS